MANTTSPNPSPGAVLSTTGVVFLVAYLLLVAAVTLNVMIAVWPDGDEGPAQSASMQVDDTDGGRAATDAGTPLDELGTSNVADAGAPSTKTSPAKTASTKSSATKDEAATNASRPRPRRVRLFWGEWVVSSEVALVLLVLASGALGSLVHALRSVAWYVGNRFLYKSWAIQYLLQPIIGSLMALVFYLVIRGGLFTWKSSTGSEVNPFGFAAVAVVIGMFSQQAALKLKDVAETLFTKPSAGAEALPQGSAPGTPPSGTTASSATGLAITGVTPRSGSQIGGDTVMIQGSGFKAGATVAFGGRAASAVTVLDETSMRVKTPAGDPATVDLSVTVSGVTAALAKAFEYK
jgi:hypothetical protein